MAALAIAGLGMAGASQATTVPINLNTWTQMGPLGNGNWNVATDGQSVLQTINGNPTYFVSPDSFINSTFEGSFGVESGGNWDDDYIGFVFGLQDANEFWLFDWKQGDQSGSSSGFTLSYVTGGPSAIPFGNHGSDDTDYDVVDTDYADDGWDDNTVYDFLLTYQDNRIKIEIDGSSIFDILNSDSGVPNQALSGGNFRSGQFGFYNYSQEDVRYQGFTQEDAPSTPNIPEPTTLALIGAGLAGMGALRRRKTE